ncbi:MULTISPECIES: alpha/beta fold hydrolase [Sphingosinicellaceae]|uniref:alpha/beta fold hydrolase n=1 Tax=Sphingosinicellaceae TaxID=2820280 RepID=UPI001C1E442A|nr:MULTISPECIES: alpha/beta fold hydrolase [Polymorphobacter]QYE35674.1 alpha/beta hydrolase [Polymorphobacter sp. PAMC 29334]UAJ10958.1 alpha/beta hydrolase [Polymorphobacter megasporae]
MLRELGERPVAAPLLAGFGGTPAAVGGPSLDGYARQLAAAARGPWIAVGHSMGAKVALESAVCGAPGLLGLILISPSPPTPEPISDEARRKALAAWGNRAAATVNLTAITGGAVSAEVLAQCVEDELSVDEVTWRWWYTTGSLVDISAAASKVNLPVLVLTGDNDKVLGLEVAVGVTRHFANAALDIIPGGGHLVPLEQPGVVAGHIREFASRLAELSAA